jgi:hypothetical protein
MKPTINSTSRLQLNATSNTSKSRSERKMMCHVILTLALTAALMPAVAHAKRVAPPKVEPVVHEGVRYVAPNDDGQRAYVQAWDTNTTKMLWEVTVFRNRIIPDLEEDVQHVYIRQMSIRDGKLLVIAENNRAHSVDLKTRAVERLKQSPGEQKPEHPTTNNLHPTSNEAGSAGGSQDAARARQTIPLVVLDNVPLKDAIRNLMRQTGQNYMLDPKLEGPWVGPDGKSGREPSVTVRWENVTAEDAVGRLLKEHGLALVANPATSIARIAFASQAVKPVPASAVGSGTNAAIALVAMDSVPFEVAVGNLAKQAGLSVTLDPATPSSGMVSIRWENVTARQALAALLDNYNLVMVEVPGTSSAKIVPNAKP